MFKNRKLEFYSTELEKIPLRFFPPSLETASTIFLLSIMCLYFSHVWESELYDATWNQ